MKDKIKISKYLAKHLRHSPEDLGLTLETGGWVNIDDLLEAADSKGFSISREELEDVVFSNDKQRFSISDDGTKIRANQGHSTAVDMDFKSAIPPDVLYHGTVAKFLPAIKSEGLKKMNRHHVHLSRDVETATKVGSRRGKPVILEIRSGSMAAAGYKFYISANGVWLTDDVPTIYINEM